jgi:hypothetical protein
MRSAERTLENRCEISSTDRPRGVPVQILEPVKYLWGGLWAARKLRRCTEHRRCMRRRLMVV